MKYKKIKYKIILIFKNNYIYNSKFRYTKFNFFIYFLTAANKASSLLIFNILIDYMNFFIYKYFIIYQY